MIDFWTILHILPVVVIVYFYAAKKYSYWSSRGVAGPKPIFPFGYLLSKALHAPEKIELELTQKYGKLYGVYTGFLPTLTVTDSNLIKQILVKDFHLFIDRRELNPYHENLNTNLFFTESENWKRIRSITSPAFSSGKLRGMYPIFNECISKLSQYLDNVTNNSGLINTKEVMAGFTIDVIASSAFATKTNANDGKGRDSPFVYHGLNLFNFNPFKLMLAYSLPRTILNALNIKTFFPNESFQFFIDLTSNIVEQRKANPGQKSNDLIQLMMDAFTYEEDLAKSNYNSLTASMDDDEIKEENATENSNKTKKQMSKSEIIAQCYLFFIAGFETTASTLSHATFELTNHPEVQERLLEEVSQKVAGLDPNNLDQYFDAILNNTPYLDAVIKETLRKYPPVVRLERRVGADNVKIAGIPLDKDVLIEIPTVSVHYDPDYYPDPERFNPDRFLPENKDQLVPYTYLPFGQGPRNCLGMRFAYQEAKLCLAHVLLKYRFTKSQRTPSTLEFRKGQLMMNCLPFEVKVDKR